MKEQENFDFSKEPGSFISKRKIINSGEPLISIVTPYYNADKYIEQTTISILNQTFPFWEWIIVNDGSTNTNTEEVLKNICNKDSRIRVLNKKIGGPAAARYYGVQNSKSDIIFCLDADDLIDNTMLECGYFSLLTNPMASFAYTSICTFGDDNYLYSPLFDTMAERKENLISVAAFIRKEDFLSVKDYPTLPKGVHEDWYMWLSLLSRKCIPIRMNFYGFWYRRMNTGRLNSINSDKKKSKIAEKYIKNKGNKIKERVGAIQFPTSCNYDFDTYPNQIEWKKAPINVKGEKKRLLCIFPWSVIGGADIFNLNLLTGLKKNGYEITVVTTEPREYMFRQSFEEVVDEYFDLTTFLNRKDWAPFISYLIKSRNIDIVLESNSFYGYYAIPWLKCKHPDVIFTDYLHAEDWSWRDGSYPRDSNAICKYLDRTFTCTKYLKDLMLGRMNRKVDNIDVAYIGTDVEYFNPNSDIPGWEELRNKYSGKKIILFPSRFEYLKRPLLLAKVVAEIVKERKDIICIAAGYGKAKEDMEAEISKLGIEKYFEIVGSKKDLRPYYKIADVTVVCSLTEGLTLIAYESLAMGVPVVTADVGGQKELIDDTCGRVIRKYQSVEKDLHNFNYDENEICDYKKAILELIEAKDEKLEKICRNKVVNGFSIENMVDKMTSTFDHMISYGTQVDKSITDTEEIAERYLMLFNEYYKQFYYNPDEIPNRTKLQKFRDVLWNFSIYRGIIKLLQKTGIMKMLKKINKK